VEIHKAAKP